MIKNSDGKRISPKMKARNLVTEKLSELKYWPKQTDHECENMTKRECTEIDRALNGLLTSIYKRHNLT